MSSNSKTAPDSLPLLTGKDSGLAYPAAVSAPGGSGKFDRDGTALAHPGNTFICHIDRQSVFYRSLCQLQNTIRALPQARYLTFLPKPSFHMTIFCGISGAPLGVDGWPENTDQDATLETISRLWQRRFELLDQLGGFTVVPSHMQAPYSLSMQPASAVDGARLLDARARLEQLTGLIRGDLESYQFHVTLAYLVQWMNTADAFELVENTNRLFDEHMAGIDTVELGSVEFCRFDTMHCFTPLSEAGH